MIFAVYGILALSLVAVLFAPNRQAPEFSDAMLLAENNSADEFDVLAWLRHMRDDVICPQVQMISGMGGDHCHDGK